MNELQKSIRTILSDTREVNWLIVHELAESDPDIQEVEFSFIGGEERPNEPFKVNHGYISIKNQTYIAQLDKMITALYKEFEFRYIALANLFIILTRLSYLRDESETLTGHFKMLAGKDHCKEIFNRLIKSLNESYYKHHYSKQVKPKDCHAWLDLFNAAQYMHGISDPLRATLDLVWSGSTALNFGTIEQMGPLLRAVLFGFYGFQLEISKEETLQIAANEYELNFIVGFLINQVHPKDVAPGWLDQNLVDTFLEMHWDQIGNYLFLHVFGLSFKNKNRNLLYQELQNLIHINLIAKIASPAARPWINKLSFPNHFIALTSWLETKNIALSDENVQAVLDQFISELERFSRELPVYLSSENNDDPFKSYQLAERKYQNALAYLLLFLLQATEDQLKQIKNVCFQFKTQFYGGYRSRLLATRFSEILLYIALSGISLSGIDEQSGNALNSFYDLLIETILIPYVHSAEREEVIWYNNKDNNHLLHNTGKHFINNALKKIKGHAVEKYYEPFFDAINNIKIAEWPFERGD